MKLGSLLTLIFTTFLLLSCSSDETQQNLDDSNDDINASKMAYEKAKKDFDANYSDKFNDLQEDLEHWDDTISNFTTANFIGTILQAPVINTDITLTIDDPVNDIVGNTFFYTIPEFDSEDLEKFKIDAMMRDFSVTSSLDFYRLIDRGMARSFHDSSFERFHKSITTEANDNNYATITGAYEDLANYSSARYLVIIKPLISQEPKMNPIESSESGTIGSGVIVYDREERLVISKFVALGTSTKTYTPDYATTTEAEMEDALKELQRDLVSEFQSQLKGELSERFNVEGEFPRFEYIESEND